MTGMLTVPSNVDVGSGSRSLRSVPWAVYAAASKVMFSAMGSALLADEHDPVRRAGHCAADVDQVALRVHPLDAQAALRVALGAVVTGHLLALDHARRVG